MLIYFRLPQLATTTSSERIASIEGTATMMLLLLTAKTMVLMAQPEHLPGRSSEKCTHSATQTVPEQLRRCGARFFSIQSQPPRKNATFCDDVITRSHTHTWPFFFLFKISICFPRRGKCSQKSQSSQWLSFASSFRTERDKFSMSEQNLKLTREFSPETSDGSPSALAI